MCACVCVRACVCITKMFHDNFRKRTKCLIPSLDHVLFIVCPFPRDFLVLHILCYVLKQTQTILFYFNSKIMGKKLTQASESSWSSYLSLVLTMVPVGKSVDNYLFVK